MAACSGGAQPNISQGIIRNLEIPVPPLDQQKRIVAEIEKQFSRLDEAVANLKRVKANLKRYKAAVLKAAVEGRLVETEAELARREGRSLPTPRPGVFYVYAIRCNDDSIYIGHTDNLARRWEEHLAGQAADWTKQHKPIQIVHYEEYTSRQEAADREKWLKTGYGRKWIKREIEAGRARQVGYETGAQLLQRILETRRQQWLARAEQAGGKGKGKYKEATVPDTTDLPELPEGWVWATVGSLGDVIGGLTKNPKRAKLKRRLPYLRVANVYANELRLEEIEEIGVEDNELEKLLVQKGDLLVVEGNGSPEQIGRLAIWDGSISPCVHQNHLIKGVCKNNCVTGFSLTAASARRTGS
jgi:predicted GIY-YIG superfamily endonuclease